MQWEEFLDMDSNQLTALNEAIERKQSSRAQQQAQFMALVANCHKGEKGKAFQASDFLPKQAEEEVNDDALYQKFVALHATLGGKTAED